MKPGLLAVLGIALVLVGHAGGAPTWGLPVQISSGARALGPELALNAVGEGLVVWDQEVGSDCATSPASLSCIHIVEASARERRSKTWGPPVEISRPGVGSTPRPAIDSAGDAAILWVHDIGRDRVLQATYRHGSSGSFPEPNDLSEPRLEIKSHHVALDDAGNAVAVWAERSQGAFDAMAAVRPAATGGWSTPVRLSSLDWRVASGPELVVTPSGRAAVAWIDGDDVVWVRTGDASTGGWRQPTPLSTGVGPHKSGVQLATNAAGDMAVVWAAGDPGSDAAVVQASVELGTGDWSPPADVGTAQTAASGGLQVAVDGSGNVRATWVGASGVLVGAFRPSSVGWGAQELVAPGSGASDPHLTMDASGNTVVVWTDGVDESVQAAIVPGALDEWQPPIALSGPGATSVETVLDAAGEAVATWARSSSSQVVVETANLVENGPLLERLTTPKRVLEVGARARFSVRPVPWTSPLVGEPVWQFGDGTSARGTHVVHAYRRAGRFAVTVSQADTAGGTETATRAATVVGALVRNARRPSILGVPRVGHTLTCLHGVWTGSPPIRYAYGWRRDGTPIPGATTARYRLARRDAGSLVACEVVATNPGGSAGAVSAVVGVRR